MSSLRTKLIATPLRPNLPLLPILCKQSSLLVGRSQLMTRDTYCTSRPRPHISVAIRTRLVPERNYSITPSLSVYDRSPCIQHTVKLFSLIFVAKNSTFFRVLQKITACVIIRVSYRSHSVSNFHSSFSTITQNYFISSKDSSSRFTRIFTGLRIKSFESSRISYGIVAEHRTHCKLGGKYRYISYTLSLKPLANISSASSRTKSLIPLGLRFCRRIISATRPGVPEIT